MFGWIKAMAGPSSARDPRDDFWFEPIGQQSGARVSSSTAMSIAAFYACVRLISETLGQLPLGVFERRPNGDKEPRANHPLYDLLHDQPNEEHTAIEFREMMTAWAAMRGTAVAEIVPGRRGSVDQLLPLHPDHIRAVEVKDSSNRSQWQIEHKAPGEPGRRLLRDEVFILRAMGIQAGCPIFGLDPISAQAATLGAAIAGQDYAARFFQNDARPSIAIKHPSYFKEQKDRETWLSAFRRKFTGAGRHSPLLLEWGMDVQQLSITPEQAQFLETRKLHAEDVARIMRVPPHKIGIMDRATFSNIEHQALEFVSDTVVPWATRWEQAIRRDLMTSPRFFAEHNLSGLLRGDLKTRYEAYAIGRNWGWLNVNEIRRKENQNSIGEEGDVYLQPLNMVEAGDPQDPSQQDENPGRPRRPQDGDRAAGPPLIIPPGKPARINGEESHG